VLSGRVPAPPGVVMDTLPEVDASARWPFLKAFATPRLSKTAGEGAQALRYHVSYVQGYRLVVLLYIRHPCSFGA
jgi:hypothetical protein